MPDDSVLKVALVFLLKGVFMMMKKLVLCVAVFGLVSSGVPYSVEALTIGFAPSSQTVSMGDSVQVDVIVSSLGGEVVSAYDLDVLYDSSILLATGVTFGVLLGDEAWFEVFNDSDTSLAGVIDFAQLSLLSDADLVALQPDSFTLATLEFQAIGSGTSSLDFMFDAFNDIKGLDASLLEASAEPGSVTVANPIPEPHAALVFGLGALVIGVRAKWRAIPVRAL